MNLQTTAPRNVPEHRTLHAGSLPARELPRHYVQKALRGQTELISSQFGVFKGEDTRGLSSQLLIVPIYTLHQYPMKPLSCPRYISEISQGRIPKWSVHTNFKSNVYVPVSGAQTNPPAAGVDRSMCSESTSEES